MCCHPKVIQHSWRIFRTCIIKKNIKYGQRIEKYCDTVWYFDHIMQHYTTLLQTTEVTVARIPVDEWVTCFIMVVRVLQQNEPAYRIATISIITISAYRLIALWQFSKHNVYIHVFVLYGMYVHALYRACWVYWVMLCPTLLCIPDMITEH